MTMFTPTYFLVIFMFFGIGIIGIANAYVVQEHKEMKQIVFAFSVLIIVLGFSDLAAAAGLIDYSVLKWLEGRRVLLVLVLGGLGSVLGVPLAARLFTKRDDS